MSETIYVIMCRQTELNYLFAWEAHRDRHEADWRVKELSDKNPRCHFEVLKTKLES